MIVLPFPPSILSGHSKGSHWSKTKATKQWRQWAYYATLEAAPAVPGEGDITIRVRFVPPDRRSDRTNFANRMKPVFDGIADALGVNDRRFLPAYEYAEPEKPGRIEVVLPGDNLHESGTLPGDSAMQSAGREDACNVAPGPDHACEGGPANAA